MSGMKVLFLDHDGVICLYKNWASRTKKRAQWRRLFPTAYANDERVPVKWRFDDFDSGAIKVLNQIIEQTGCEIVVSSDWRRNSSLEEMGEYYQLHGILKRPIDFTPVFDPNWRRDGFLPGSKEFPWSRTYELEQERYFEILKWLSLHPEVSNYCVVDDLDMGNTWKDYSGEGKRDWGFQNYVRTPLSTEGIKQLGIAQKIINILNN
jgi:hypothetical protein